MLKVEWQHINETTGCFVWIDIEGISTLVNFTDNDSANGTIPIGFEFPIYGQSYTECSINANGWIGFGGDSGAWDNSNLPTDEVPGPALFPFWDDLKESGDIGYTPGLQVKMSMFNKDNDNNWIDWQVSISQLFEPIVETTRDSQYSHTNF